MKIEIFESKNEMGAAAAQSGFETLRENIASNGDASFIIATGASQFEMLEELRTKDLPWSNMDGFHLDEYIGMPITHDASFRKYLWQRFVSQLPIPLRHFYFLDGERMPPPNAKRVGQRIAEVVIDVAFVGIGENGHLAFNDPPADFDTEDPYLIVDLDDACRQQQLGEGWFATFDDVPQQAISMSIKQIMKSKTIVCTVPDERKSEAVKNALEGPVSPTVPASILQEHPDCRVFLDKAAASKLSN